MDRVAMDNNNQAKTLEEIKSTKIHAGKSLEEIEKEEFQSALEETAMMWALFETQGCGSSHPFQTMCSEECLNEAWRYGKGAEDEREAASVGLRLAAALDALGKRNQAIKALQRALHRRPDCARVRLQLAKIYFRTKQHDLALETLQLILSQSTTMFSDLSQSTMFSDLDNRIMSDAFYIAGWAYIHGFDDHTTAYQVWKLGANTVPDDPRLSRQLRKLNTWDPVKLVHDDDNNNYEKKEIKDGCWLGVGDGAVITSREATDVDIIYDHHVDGQVDPALSLFDSSEQKRAIAFTTRRPLMSESECKAVLDEVNKYIQSEKKGVWGTVRRSLIPTTDCAVEDIPPLIPWLRRLLASRIYPLIEACFPKLADGTRLEATRLRVHDAFIVRYDSSLGSIALPEHSDTSVVSVSLSLSSEEDGDFAGGGLWLERIGLAVPAPRGCATIFAGPLRHGGAPITSGVRMILVLFLYVEGFSYGTYLETAKKAKSLLSNEPKSQPALVVYRETVQLVEALETNE